jgi:RNA polymerase sigma factor (sigma-70 family)
VNNQFGSHSEDKDLIGKVLGGDTHAFENIIKNTEGLVAQIIFKMVPNREDRKDLVQEIYLKAFHKLAGFKFHSKLSTWIGQIAYNACLSWLEKKKLLLPGNFWELSDGTEEALETASNKSSELHTSDAESIIFRKELSAILQIQMDKLPPIYKTLLILYHQEELSYEEIMQITSLPMGTVKSYLFRARRMLKDNLLTSYKKEEL